MMNNKMTNKVALEIAIEAVRATGNEEAVAKLEKILEQTIKKNSAERKPTATQTANEGLKNVILTHLAGGASATISQMMKEIPELEGLANQKVTALVRQLKDEGKVIRFEEKRKAFFKLAEIEEEE
jgi:hypothetical protein